MLPAMALAVCFACSLSLATKTSTWRPLPKSAAFGQHLREDRVEGLDEFDARYGLGDLFRCRRAVADRQAHVVGRERGW